MVQPETAPDPNAAAAPIGGAPPEIRAGARLGTAPGPGRVFTPPELARRLCEGLPLGGRALDPACGDGALLAALLERVPSAERRAAALRLHGVELDPELARRARARLLRAAGCGDGALARALERQVVCADALDPACPWPAGTDVVANPPWASLSGRQALELAPERLALYRRAWRALAGWPSLHGAFLERIAAHVGAEGTRARALLPAPVCSLDGYAPLRRVVTEHCALAGRPVELGERAFPGVTEPAVLLGLVPRAPGQRASAAGWTPCPPGEAALIERLAHLPRLSPDAFGDPGVHTGNCAAELVARGSGRRSRRGEPLREGRDLSPFALGPPHATLRTDLARAPGRRFRILPLARYRAVPVVLRQTAGRPMAALHEPAGYFRNTLLACVPPAGIDPAFAVAVLNGPVAAAWHRLCFADARQRAFPQVKVGHLRTQPFPIAHRDEAPELHDRVAALVRSRGPRARAEIEELVLAAFALASEDEARVGALAQ